MAEELDLKVKAVPIDINDLQLADEAVEINGDADAFAGPPPPDDGDHRVKLSLDRRGVTKGTSKTGSLFYMVALQAKVIAGQFENRILFDNASTMVMQNTGTSRMAGIMKALGETISGRTSIVELTRAFVARLTGEPDTIVQSQWTAYCQDCNEENKATGGKKGKKGGIVLRGQRRFPENGDKSHRAQVECPNCGSLLNARAEIVAYKPVPREG